MTNLTLSIDDELLKRARIHALEQDTSVNTLVRDYLENLVAERSPRSGMAEFLVVARSVHAGSGKRGRTWTRDELYER
jgi:biotin-(acetyl-CoA carboxylase) ligase